MAFPTADTLVAEISALAFPDAFNPWSSVCPKNDLEDAPALRRNNLTIALKANAEASECTLWVARDLGYRGGRRTGLALTDDVSLIRHARMLGVSSLSRATHGPPVKERTAAAIWDALEHVQGRVFLWNVFPLHPHAPEEPMTNRAHTRAEARACEHVLDGLLRYLRPTKVVAIGGDAKRALAAQGISATPVRHPSYGGEREFREALARAYDVPAMAQPRQQALAL